jgi:sugar O-acyltransferase (sialic acid O-acetyltransferase NeuD family)
VTRPIVIGAGGHASVLVDALAGAGQNVIGCTAREGAGARLVCGVPVLGDDSILSRWRPDQIHLVNGLGSVGTGDARKSLQVHLESQGWVFVGVRHATTTVSAFAHVADDAQLLAHCVVQPGARIARGCIVNTGAIVEHDVQLGAWVHVAPRAMICGECAIGEHSHVGAGSVVRQQIVLGARSLVGIGAAVVSDFAGNGCIAGIPARPLSRHLEQNK